eukprot:m.39522 g.39522  ORF g.39522 m.39522 type:complete len:518 (+) comp18222_c0_seq2:187-1740(+)
MMNVASNSQQSHSGFPEIQQMYSSYKSPSTISTGMSLPNINDKQNPTSASRTKYTSLGTTPYSPSNSQPKPRRGSLKEGALSPSAALQHWGRVLSPFEQEEIKHFNHGIYFVGPSARKLNAGEGKGKNFGFDDDKGRYKCVKNDHIYYRYEVQKGLGKGSFGDVVKAYDHKTKSTVALKIIRNEKRFHKQGKCEVKILDHLRRHDKDHANNVIHMKDYFIFRNHLCITFEMMHTDMYTALKKDGFRGYGLDDVADFAKQMCVSLSLLKQHRIIHCDLKPENILLKTGTGTGIKIIDFGSSCFDHERVHSYIQSRFYRSPEVILGLSYGTAIDMWSLGCILAELHTGQPLFPGHDEKEQLMYQMQTLGVPSLNVLNKAKRRDNFFSPTLKPLHITDRKGRVKAPGTKTLTSMVGSDNAVYLDFIEKCLTWDPATRMTPSQAMEHPFITSVPTPDILEPSLLEHMTSLVLGGDETSQENQPPSTSDPNTTNTQPKSAKKHRTHLSSVVQRLKSRKASKK